MVTLGNLMGKMVSGKITPESPVSESTYGKFKKVCNSEHFYIYIHENKHKNIDTLTNKCKYLLQTIQQILAHTSTRHVWYCHSYGLLKTENKIK